MINTSLTGNEGIASSEDGEQFTFETRFAPIIDWLKEAIAQSENGAMLPQQMEMLMKDYGTPESLAKLKTEFQQKAGEITQFMADLVGKIGEKGKEALLMLKMILQIIGDFLLHPPRETKIAVRITEMVVLFIFLMSCASAPANATSTARAKDTPSPIIQIVSAPTNSPTISPLPTFIPPTPRPIVPPTAEAAATAEYVAKSENKYPIPPFDGLGEWFAKLDFGNLIFVNEMFESEGRVGSYCILRDGGVTFIAPCFSQTEKFAYSPLNSGIVKKPTQPGNWEFDDSAVKSFLRLSTDALGVTGQDVRVRVLIGNNPSSILKGDLVPYVDTFSQSNLDEATIEFMRTGNYKLLPLKTIQGVTGYLLPAIRITPAR